MGFSNVPLDSGVGEQAAYNHLNGEHKPILYVNAKEGLHGFNKHWVFQECNYGINKGKVVFCFVQDFTKGGVCFTILENHFSNGKCAHRSWITNTLVSVFTWSGASS